jgi:hypothetical protein
MNVLKTKILSLVSDFKKHSFKQLNIKEINHVVDTNNSTGSTLALRAGQLLHFGWIYSHTVSPCSYNTDLQDCDGTKSYLE